MSKEELLVGVYQHVLEQAMQCYPEGDASFKDVLIYAKEEMVFVSNFLFPKYVNVEDKTDVL